MRNYTKADLEDHVSYQFEILHAMHDLKVL
jgi:hypothetical protein